MARINNTAAYATETPTADSIVIGSTESGGDTKNFQMSDISTFVLGNAVTPTLDDVCQQGASTTTGITVAGTTTLNGVLDANSTADISGNTTIGGTLGVSQAATFALGVTIDNAGLAVNGSGGIIVGSTSGISSFGPISGTALNSTGGLLVSGTSVLGEIDASGVADIADTLTLSKVSGTGLQVDADANIDGNLTITLGSALYTDEIRTTSPSSNLAFYSGGFQRGSFTALGVFSLTGGLQVQTGGALMNQGLTVNNLAQFNDDVLFGGSVPSSSTDTGSAGQIAVDATHIYVCVGTNSWGRVAIDTTPF